MNRDTDLITIRDPIFCKLVYHFKCYRGKFAKKNKIGFVFGIGSRMGCETQALFFAKFSKLVLSYHK